ncbi:MAG: hypothetical protein D6696_13115 [Acidobacteria bacterium]|nr:MAG: hypothetical protein D6696_13115 [Acidobacteriota bacterium]
MKKTALSLALVAIVLSSLAFAAAGADANRTLTGEYVWDQTGRGGALEAVFTPTGDGTWEVSFHFTFRGRPHTYSGTAEGSLDDGPLEGTVKNENRRRTFTFQGTVEGGLFRGTHAEIEDGRAYRTGTLTLEG